MTPGPDREEWQLGERRRTSWLVGVAVALAACTTSPTLVITSPASTSAPSPSIAATPIATLAIDDLPEATLDPAIVTAVCDPEAAQANIEAGDATIFCGDALPIGLRAISTIATGPVSRLYFHRPTCVAIPCTEDELATATIWGWTAEGALRIELDSRMTTVTAPVRDPTASWPAAGTAPAPPVDRPDIPGAPAEIRDRVPYPFCGSASFGQPPAAMACMRSAVLAGRPAELIDTATGTEGGSFTILYRFDGRGAISRAMDPVDANGRAGPWLRQWGTLILGITPSTWDFDPWSGTDLQL
jgi:hypothetical protein